MRFIFFLESTGSILIEIGKGVPNDDQYFGFPSKWIIHPHQNAKFYFPKKRNGLGK